MNAHRLNVKRQAAKARNKTDKDIVHTHPSCDAKALQDHECKDDPVFLPPLPVPEANIEIVERPERKRTKVGYKQDWSPVTEIMLRYDISAEAGQELLKGFAEVTGAKITSIASKTLLNRSKAKAICGRRDTSVEIIQNFTYISLMVKTIMKLC